MSNFRKPRQETPVDITVSQEQESVTTPSPAFNPSDVLKLIKESPETLEFLKSMIGSTIKSEEPGEKLRESRRKYGFELDGVTIRKDEPRKYKYRILMDEGVEKAIIKCDTVGRPISDINHNTGKRINEHTVEMTFQDGSKKRMDLTEYLQRTYYAGESRD